MNDNITELTEQLFFDIGGAFAQIIFQLNIPQYAFNHISINSF